MSKPTARKYRESGKLPSDLNRRHDWRTRANPFAEVWPEIVTLLDGDGHLQGKTIFEDLQRRCPGKFPDGQLRTLQLQIRKWRALWLDQKTPGDAGGITESAMTALLKDPVFRNTLDHRQFIAKHGETNLSAFAKVEANQEFLAWVMKNTDLMDTYMEAATPDRCG